MTAQRHFPSIADSEAAREEHNTKAKIRKGGRWWYAPRAASEYLDVSTATLTQWASACPWLEGKPIESRKLEGGFGRKHVYYALSSLDAVIRTREKTKRIPTVPGFVYIDDAYSLLGWSVRTLRRRMKDAGAKVKKVKAYSDDGRARPKSFVPRWFVDQCQQSRKTEAKKPKAKVTVREAANILELSIQGVHSLIGRGVLLAEEDKTKCKGGYPRKGLLLSRADVLAREHEMAERGRQAKKRRKTQPDEDRRLLEKALADGPRPCQAVRAGLRKVGLSKHRIDAAKKAAGVVVSRRNHYQHWWTLPESTEPVSRTDQPSAVMSSAAKDTDAGGEPPSGGELGNMSETLYPTATVEFQGKAKEQIDELLGRTRADSAPPPCKTKLAFGNSWKIREFRFSNQMVEFCGYRADLTGAQWQVLKGLSSASDNRRTAGWLLKECPSIDELSGKPSLRNHIKSARAAIRKVVAEAGVLTSEQAKNWEPIRALRTGGEETVWCLELELPEPGGQK